MHFTEDHIRNQINESNIANLFNFISTELYNKDFSDLMIEVDELKIFNDSDYLSRLKKLNEVYMGIHEFMLYNQRPEYLRIELVRSIKTIEVQIFHKNLFIGGYIYNKKNYLAQTYIKLLDMYELPTYDDISAYKKKLNRDKIINDLLNE